MTTRVSSSHRTSSIPRPRRAGVVGRMRAAVPTRSGRADMGDETRLIQRRRNRNLMAIVGTLIALVIAAALLILPIRTWLSQRTELAERRQELAALEAANARIAAANERLQTAEGISETARNDLGYVAAGEEHLTVLPAPATGDELPPRWPYTVVSDIFAVRIEAGATAGASPPAATDATGATGATGTTGGTAGADPAASSTQP